MLGASKPRESAMLEARGCGLGTLVHMVDVHRKRSRHPEMPDSQERTSSGFDGESRSQNARLNRAGS